MDEQSAGLAEALLQAWDDGCHVSPGERGLILLRLAAPALPEQARADLAVGHRDAALLDLYERLFGGTAGAVADCTRCGEPLEFDVALRDIRVAPPVPPRELFHLNWAGGEIAYRLPRARDLAALGAALGTAPVAQATRSLARRCVVSVDGADGEISDEAPSAVEQAITDRVPQADPQALVTLSFACPACGTAGRAPFDIVAFLWRRVGLMFNCT